MRKTHQGVLGAVLTLLLAFGLAAPASAATTATPPRTAATITVSALSLDASRTVVLAAKSGPQRWGICGSTNWGTKNPKTCKSTYKVYEWSTAMQRPVLKFQVTKGTNIWPYVAKGYKATQDWCAKNSLTCGVITSVGVTIVGGWLKNAITG